MAKTDTDLSDTEWEEKFNGPRNSLLKKIFGDAACPVNDISQKVIIRDKNWNKKIDFMVTDRPRIHKNMNSDISELANLKAKPDLVK